MMCNCEEFTDHRACLSSIRLPPSYILCLSRLDFQQHHAVAVHVDLGRDGRAADPLRREVSGGGLAAMVAG
jgi:hypothetical protein